MVSQSFRFSPNVELLTARAVDLIWNSYPGYSSDVFDKKELIPSVANNIRLGVRVLRRGSPPTYAELVEGRGLGSRRASQAVPLESVIQAYRATERTIILDLFGGSQAWPVELTSHYADLIISTFDLLTEEMINSYRETSSAIEAAQRRAENELVAMVASGETPARADIDRWSRSLDVDPTAPHFALVLASNEEADHVEVSRLRRRLARALQPFVTGPVLFGDMSRATIGLVPSRGDPAALMKVLAETLGGFSPSVRLVAGVGALAPTLVEAAESCKEALAAADIARRRAEGPTVVEFKDVLIDVLLSRQSEIGRKIYETRLSNLEKHAHLMETLVSLIENDLSQSRVARSLFVHVNTVTHRLRRIHEITGFDPLSLRDLLEMGVALRWKELV